MKDPVLDSSPVTDRSAEYASEYAIYKPNSRGTGGVIRFGLNAVKGALFVDAANQITQKQFNWENKLTMKWGLSDLGSVIAVLQGRMPQAKLFHQSERANSAFEITRQDDPERAPYLVSISRQTTADKSLRKITLPLGHGEAAILEVALQKAVVRLLGW